MKGGTLAMLDGRKRVSLAQVATTDTYLMFVEKNGRIILEPAVVMTEEERAILENAAVRDSVDRSRQQTNEHRPRRRLK